MTVLGLWAGTWFVPTEVMLAKSGVGGLHAGMPKPQSLTLGYALRLHWGTTQGTPNERKGRLGVRAGKQDLAPGQA